MNYRSDFKDNSALEKKHEISGKIETFTQQGFFTSNRQNRVVLYIDNKLVVKSPLNDDLSGRTELYYNSKLLILECGKDNLFAKPKCIVEHGGQNLGTLTFDFDFNR